MVRGKRKRGVPILFTKEMVEAVQLMLAKRQELKIEGPYVFVNSSNNALRGSDCLRKFVNFCGAKFPRTLTSGSLRKQVATMVQLLNLRDNELDQLATFMGHDIRVHRDFYRLPDATIQVAKLSKVLILMENGDLKNLKGKNLDELDLDMPPCATSGSDASDSEENELAEGAPSEQAEGAPNEQTTPPRAHGMKKQPNGKSQKRRIWTAEEKAAVRRSLGKFLDSHKVPGQSDCLIALAQEPALRERNWKDLKYQVYNQIKASKKKLFV